MSSTPTSRVMRNVCIVMAVVETVIAIRFAIDMAMGGDTQWWQTVSATAIAAALYRLWWIYNSRIKSSSK